MQQFTGKFPDIFEEDSPSKLQECYSGVGKLTSKNLNLAKHKFFFQLIVRRSLLKDNHVLKSLTP
ncbi:MAG: hypothetical protein O4861_08420 [Trichodesmium sp. St16_bin4-tuft]|nr:hypothetical protein [Trichodesmium sp. MAG_R01]MDE5070737.1 hypothetical protein [Trichodesmium sp. St5_bin8]MDE5077942.1 hypothetical protein [Trichodesmium sp. St2_bin6]MDE5098356.1 hypothetical protein [Trichodesmium sp. St16_bin4-tuft]